MNKKIILLKRGKESSFATVSEDILEKYRSLYHDSIYYCNKFFSKSSSWWYTPLSSREWYSSELQRGFQLYPKIEALLRNQMNSELLISPNSAFEFDILTHLSKESGYVLVHSTSLKLRLLFKEIISFLNNLKTFCSLMAVFLILSFKNIFTLFFKNNHKVDVVFFAPLHDGKFKLNQNNLPFDRYFGDLPSIYYLNDARVEILGLPDNLFCSSFFYNSERFKIAPVFKYWKFSFIFRIILNAFKELFFAPKLYENYKGSVVGFHKQVNREIRKFYGNRILAKAYEYSCENFILTHKPKYIFHTFENNWWERAIDRVAQRNRDIVKKNIGYLHCAILDSHFKYFMCNDEWDLKYRPDSILVTGKIAKDILLSRGNYPANSIDIGYDLRGPNLYNISNANKFKDDIKNILVLLEGLDTMPDFLLLVLESLPLDIYQLKVRCHPVYPIEKPEFNKIRNHELYPKLTVTRGTTLEDDLNEADLVVYKGSTSALYAAYKGIPLLRFQDDWWASDDPLIGCNSLKKTFSNSVELLEGIEQFKLMKEEVFSEEQKKMQAYVFDYMNPYKDSELNHLASKLIS